MQHPIFTQSHASALFHPYSTYSFKSNQRNTVTNLIIKHDLSPDQIIQTCSCREALMEVKHFCHVIGHINVVFKYNDDQKKYEHDCKDRRLLENMH